MQIRDSRGAHARFKGLRAAAFSACLFALHVVAQAQIFVPGKAQDQISVLPNGGASYRVAIKVPPNIPGVVPKLELAYTGTGLGSVGLGWTIGGLSRITRCPRTMAQDGVRGAIRFDSNDRFCLDGQRLILVSGTYGQDGAEYRTELETFSKIVSYTSVPTRGPDWFKVWTKEGQIKEYGHGNNDAANKVVPVTNSPLDQNIVKEWWLNQLSDPSGNYFTVRYQWSTDGSHIPSGLNYGGNLIDGGGHFGIVSFGAPGGFLPVVRYLAGTKSNAGPRISTVNVNQSASPVAKTTLAYDLPAQSAMARVTSLQMCDGAGTRCLSPVNFTYATASGGFASTTTTWALPTGASSPVVGVATQLQTHGFSDTFEFGTPSVPVTRTQTHVAMADMNGDGLPDLYITAYTPPSGGNPEIVHPGQVYFNTGTGFSSTGTAWPLPAGVKAQKDIVGGKTITMLIDINGDGLPDLYKTLGPLAAGNPRGEVYLNTGSGFSSTATPWALPAAIATANVVLPNGTTQSSLLDLDGDGLVDAFLTDGTNAATVYLNTGSGFSSAAKAWPLPTSSWPSGSVPAQQQVYTYNDIWDYGTSGAPVSRTQTHVALVDMNGDGLPDIYMTFYTPGPDGGSISSGKVFFNTGIGFLSSNTSWSLPTGVKAQKDVVAGQTIVTLIDLNGDGMPDLFRTIGPLGAGNPRGEVFLNTGSGFESVAKPWALPAAIATSNVVATNGATQAALIDIDGDGFPDAYLTDGVNPGRVFLSNSPSLSKLTRVASAASPTIDITYSKLTDPAVYTKDTGPNAAVFPKVDIAAAKTVVASIAVGNGIGGSNTTTYTYGGLKNELNFGRGGLGFRWMKAKSLTTNIESYTEYRQDFPFIGLPQFSEARLAGSGNGGVLRRTTNTWTCQDPQTLAACSVAVGNRYFDYLSASTDESWDLTGATLPSTTTATTYGQNPQYGFATQVTVTSSDGSTKTTANEHWPPDTTTWRVGRIKRQSVTSVKP